MSFKRDLMIRVMLNQFHQGAPDVMLKGLPKEQGQSVMQINTVSQDAPYLLNEPKELIKYVHYSWIGPIVEGMPVKMHPLLLSSLPKSKGEALSQTMKVALLPSKPALSVRLFLLSKLAAKLKPVDILPAPYLPSTNLSPLISMRKEEIIQLIDFLGLYDLAEEIRHIVDNRYLKAIYNCLSTQKQHFLRMCLHKKEQLSVPRLGLDQWRGDSRVLEQLLHKRGLARLGKAISGQHQDFVWHLVHRLDTGRGRLLQQHYDKDEVPGVTQVLVQEILNLMNFFKKNE